MQIDAAWSRSLAAGFALAITAFASFRFFSYAERYRPLACGEPKSTIFSGLVVQHADAPGLCDGSIWPKTGCASIV